MVAHMKILITLTALCLAACGGGSAQTAAPTAAPTPPVGSRPISNVVAFMGDSITHRWDLTQYDPGPTLNFGVDANTTVQMLQRFGDVIASAPGVVVILGGINDISQYAAGVISTPQDIESIKSMAAMAHAAGIRVILCSVLPTNFHSPGEPLLDALPTTVVEDFNQQIIALAQANGYLYADYYDEMLAADGTQNTALFMDEVHPNPAGYAVMWKVIAPLLNEDLN
jgi:lysophospholipase L1-like esterase